MQPGTPQPTRTPSPDREPRRSRSGGADVDLFAHRTRTNTRTLLEPIGYDSEGAPLYAWQLNDDR